MSWFKDFLGQFQVWGATPRSPKWRSVREKFLKQSSICEGCALDFNLEVHHIIPFHIRPELELDESNLITLCRDCHWNIGHLRDWSLSNPFVRSDAKAYLERFTSARLK